MNGIEKQMIVLFIIVIVGYILRRIKMMDEEFDHKLSNFVIDVACPCLILSSVMGKTLPDKHLILPLLAVGFATYFLLILVGIFIPKFLPIPKTERGLYSFMFTFGNVGFIGYPVVSAIFGPQAIFYAVILNFPNTLLIFIIGILFIAGKGQKVRFNWKLLIAPAMIASYLSILIVAMEWRVPEVLSQPCTLLGNITIPGALLIIGSSMSTIPVKKMCGNLAIYITAALRLLIVPILLYQFFNLFGTSHTVNAVNAVVCGMPIASYGTLFCIRYNRDVTTMAEATFITTLLSVITIPILTYFL